jgi:hypothetical protein
MTPHASPLVQLGIPALAVTVLALVALGAAHRLGARTGLAFALGAALWLAVSGGAAHAGYLSRFDVLPPPLLLILLPTLLLPLLLGLSRFGSALASAPLAALVALQSFRLPLELVMHRAATEGTMPPQMTFTGANFDIVTGATAVLVAALAATGRAPRWLLLGWNALGSLLLLTVVVIAIASLPVFAAFGREPSRLNTWVAYFPFVWLPAALVSSALFGHVLLWRRLLSPNPP